MESISGFICIADPEVHVFGDRVYIFGSHDKVGGESFCLLDYEFFSSPINGEMKFTSRGINYSAKDDPGYSEESKYLYAPDVVRGNDGRYYLYYALAFGRVREDTLILFLLQSQMSLTASISFLGM